YPMRAFSCPMKGTTMSSNNVWAAWYRVLLDVHEKLKAEKLQKPEAVKPNERSNAKEPAR
ncbi:MAG: hypothetical protein ABGZ53_23165, partial [Fuerstiella sp.]